MSFIAVVAAFTAGVAAHLGFFKRGERFLYPFRYVQAIILMVIIATFAKTQYESIHPITALRSTIRLTGVFLVGLFSSVLFYRLFLNPLNRFPGPFFSRITKFDTVFRNAKMDSHHQLHKLHQKHGKFVRIGPNDLSVIDADGVQVVSAANSKCTKSSWYQQDTPLISMHTTRDRALHDRRRRVWSPAFSDKALRGYEDRIQIYTEIFMRRLTELSGQSINASKWFNLYSFDVMGELGFGKSFNMLESGETHWAIKLLGEGMDPIGVAFPTWFFRTLVAIPGLAHGYHKFIGFCTQSIEDRIKVQGKVPSTDIAHTLIEQYNQSPNKDLGFQYLAGDSRLIIVAGSDTTAATLVHLFHWFAKKPELQTRLRQELNGKHENQDIKDNNFLNGLINETLRMNPPVPSGVFRKTPKEGVHIGTTFIPGNTVIQMPHYAMGHDESIYPSCESFIPERFYSKPELINHKDAFIPFSTGPFGCIGKNLAYMEIRSLTAQIIQKFDVKFAPGEDGRTLMEKSRDHFTLELGDLDLIFVERKQ